MKQVTKDMNIREMVLMDEGIAEILMNAGMHCLGCMMSHFENLEQACAVHGIDADALVNQINEYLEATGESASRTIQGTDAPPCRRSVFF
ncbi:MAG: DUF1858 domain-containing protein [Clostridia bacterium]|nr:DUF1858 domain-containing protein [Clostridia bacterium]